MSDQDPDLLEVALLAVDELLAYDLRELHQQQWQAQRTRNSGWLGRVNESLERLGRVHDQVRQSLAVAQAERLAGGQQVAHSGARGAEGTP